MQDEGDMHGMCMAYAWNMYGTCIGFNVEYARNVHRICMEYSWNMYGVIL